MTGVTTTLTVTTTQALVLSHTVKFSVSSPLKFGNGREKLIVLLMSLRMSAQLPESPAVKSLTRGYGLLGTRSSSMSPKNWFSGTRSAVSSCSTSVKLAAG